MTAPRQLLETDRSTWLLMHEADRKATADATWRWAEAGLTVRTVRGRKMRTVDGLFDELAAALQFPYYFGENWAALDECLSEIEWLPMDVGIVLAVREPDEVLADEPAVEMAVLVRLMAKAADTYAKPIDLGEWWDRPAVPFHVVLQPEPADAAVARARWRAAGAVIGVLDQP